MLERIRHIIAYDTNVTRVLIYRMWTIPAGAITVFFVPRYLTADDQGIYYTFLSIVALQVLFDLGLSQTISQITSHEFAHVDLSKLCDPGFNRRVGKLSYIKSAVSRWYKWTGCLFIVTVSSLGALYFFLFGTAMKGEWLGPWIALVVATGVNLILSPRLAIAEGAGWTGAVATLRLVQSVSGYALLIACLVAGGGLWSVVAVPATASLCSFAWLRWYKNPHSLIPHYVPAIHDHKPWRGEIMRLQWRVAVAWLGGYFASQVIVPVIFALQGPRDAGKVGLGLQIFNAVQALGMSWVSARIPLFGQLISRADWSSLKERFARATLSATAVSTAGAIAVALALELVRYGSPLLATRIPSTETIIALAVISILGTIIYALAAYMRAHKEEPLVLSSLVIGCATFAGAVIGAKFGTDEVIFLYAVVTILLNFPWTLKIFLRYYRRDNTDHSFLGKFDVA